ncbi:GtrA family protein|uniref:GtrA family protein n=1 Tax=Stenotrophomonas TaxID=40323 RepID=UPI0015D2070E|nr:GtrA family protein [Stenotrophomonas sp. SbOxS2]NYT99520.1 GtrA family protein [Stenotrophomonas sp. SbOxS2]
MNRTQLILAYAAFAALSIAVNIATQAATIHLYAGPYAIPVSVILGTVTGLLCKYILDKRFIFAHKSASATHEARTFVLYTVMGIATTVIFWGTEATFNYIFQTDLMRYVGGIIGLGIGYIVKYHLDARFVFDNRAA